MNAQRQQAPTEPSTAVATQAPEHPAVSERARMRAVQKEIRNKSWGKDLPPSTIQAMILWSEKRGLDAATEIDILGGNIHIKGTYYLRRLAQKIGAGVIVAAYPDHVHQDPRLLAIAADEKAPKDVREDANREHYRRMLARAKYNLKDEAAAAVIYHIRVKGMDEDLIGAKHCGNGVKKNDPVGDASPAETAETRAARRAARQMIDTFPDLKAEMDVIEAEAKLVSIEITKVQQHQRALNKPRTIEPVQSGEYGTDELSGHAVGTDGEDEDDRELDLELERQG